MSIMSSLKNLADKAQETIKKFQQKPKLTPLQKKTAKNRAKRRRQGRL